MDHTQPAAVWIDGDPQMEAVAAAVWEQCRTEDTSLIVDDPRNIAAVAVAAIRTAAGAVQPDTTTADKAAALGMTPDEYRQHRHQAAVKQIQEAAKGLLAETGLRVMDALEHPVAAGVQQPEPEERRERTEPWGEVSGEFGTARQEINRLGSENARLLAELEQARTENADVDTVASRAAEAISNMGANLRAVAKERDRYRSAWTSARERAVAYGEGILRVVKDRESYQGWLKEAEARGATGQDTTVPPVEGEQEIRQQIAEALEAADYRMDMRRGDLADAVLPVVRAAVAAVQEDLAFLRRVTIPELWREVVRHADGKQRWRKRAEKAEATVAAYPARAQGHIAGDVVAYRSAGGRILRCLKHAPGDPENSELTPVTSEDLEDGGICTYPDCGVDVLITGGPTA